MYKHNNIIHCIDSVNHYTRLSCKQVCNICNNIFISLSCKLEKYERIGDSELLLNLLDIQGGGSGIGRAVCQALAAEGASIVVTDLNNQGAQETTDSLSKHVDNKHINYSLDVASGEEVQKVLECIISEYRKPPCILVNSAGITSDDFLLKMDEDKFDKVIEVNLKVVIISFFHN